MRFQKPAIFLSLLSLFLQCGSRCELTTVLSFSGAAMMVWDSELSHVICIGQQNCSQCGTNRDLCITGHQVTLSCDYWPFCDYPVESLGGDTGQQKHCLQHLHGLSHWPSINGYVNTDSLDHLYQKTRQPIQIYRSKMTQKNVPDN